MLHRHASPAVAGSYTLGALSGAAMTAGALFVANGLLSPVPQSVRGILALSLLVLLILCAVGVLCLDLPQRAYQIPRETFHQSPTRAAFRFAFELGTGVRTYITATAPYALAIVLLLCLPASFGRAALSASLGAAGYGLGRSMVVLTQSLRSAIAVDQPARWLRRADLVALVAAGVIAVRFVAS